MNDPRIITIETCTANASAALHTPKKRSIADRIIEFMLNQKAKSLRKQLAANQHRIGSLAAIADDYKRNAQLDYGVRLEEINKWRDQAAADCRHKIALLKAELEKCE